MTFDQEMHIRARDKAREVTQKLASVRSFESVERFRILTDSHVEFYHEMVKLRKEKEDGR